MPPPIEITPVDREFYESRLRDFLPKRVIDVHTHVWLGQQGPRPAELAHRVVGWPARVASDNRIEVLLEDYRRMLPLQAVTPLIFASPTAGDDVGPLNDYVADSARRHGLPSLLLSRPEWPAEELESRLRAGGFLGVKVYLSFAPAYIPPGEIRIFDFLPPHQLEVLDAHRWIAMLHIPRPSRLRDPVNLQQMLRIERDYPRVGLIIAHVGRAYCPQDVGDAFEVLAPARRMSFDISANTNEEVFGRLLAAVGPRRVLFGTDMPIVRMRMRRICEAGRYVNLVPRGLYGDVSGDPHMREVDAPEAQRLSLFLYEEIDAFRRAAEGAGLSPADIEDVFHHNARRLLDAAAGQSHRRDGEVQAGSRD